MGVATAGSRVVAAVGGNAATSREGVLKAASEPIGGSTERFLRPTPCGP
jgi:hypothetical protein